MDNEREWINAPGSAYRRWQEADATGAGRRPFSPRSIVQHASMFDRFGRHLAVRGATLATFGADHIETFFAELGARSKAGTSTALRYAKLLDRLCRHLVEVGVRSTNPAADFVRSGSWPRHEPTPVFLDEAADQRLQEYLQSTPASEPRETRNHAVVALLHGTGLTSAEIRAARCADLFVDGARPHVRVRAHGARDERIVPLPPFSLAALSNWLTREPGDLLFPLNASTGSFCEETLWRAVREALEAINFSATDMSPRVLRNTYARRQLLQGRTNEETSRLLGLSSQRTLVRIRATIGRKLDNS